MKMLIIITTLASALYFFGFQSNDLKGDMTSKVNQRIAQIDKMSE